MALTKRSVPKRLSKPASDTKKEKLLSAAEKRKEFIYTLYARCRICGFFMERKFPGDDCCCQAHRELAKSEDEGEIL